MKIYMAGAGGMLGGAFYETFKTFCDLRCTDLNPSDEWLEFCDFRDRSAYIEDVTNFSPDFLFHLGAHTSLEYCEANEQDAYLTNTIAVEYAVEVAKKLSIPLLYISTAGIFDGKKELYDDWDTPNPLGVYARSKYLAERYVVESGSEYLICRAGWMMGGGRQKDKKFIAKLMSQIEAGATVLNIVNDKDGTPTYTYDFANNVRLLLESGQRGLFNMVCGGQTSRLEVAEELLSILNLTDIVEVNEVDSQFFSEEYFAPRPPCERLVNRRLDLLESNQMQDWKTALRTYIKTSY